ncbi:unnamed protein product [Amoebophrya sp. A120]|nr:unnamed protein product [Amoebophrya sp. A120]|eukprot:GSA120T00001332001.1
MGYLASALATLSHQQQSSHHLPDPSETSWTRSGVAGTGKIAQEPCLLVQQLPSASNNNLRTIFRRSNNSRNKTSFAHVLGRNSSKPWSSEGTSPFFSNDDEKKEVLKIRSASFPHFSAKQFEKYNEFADFLANGDDHSISDLLEASPAMHQQRKLMGGQQADLLVKKLMTNYAGFIGREANKEQDLPNLRNFLSDAQKEPEKLFSDLQSAVNSNEPLPQKIMKGAQNMLHLLKSS